jgi:hypothetical protein
VPQRPIDLGLDRDTEAAQDCGGDSDALLISGFCLVWHQMVCSGFPSKSTTE